MTELTNSMTNAFTTGANDMLTVIGNLLPVVLPVMIAVAVIGVGIKVFKKISGR